MKNLKTGAFIAVIALFVTVCMIDAQKKLNTNGLTIIFDEQLKVTGLYGDAEYLPVGAEGYLLRVKAGDNILLPKSAKWKGGDVNIVFDRGIHVSLLCEQKEEYLTFNY